MERTLNIGEVNNRILLTVTAINILIDYELTLNGLTEELAALRKKRETYVQALKASEERALAMREKYAKLIREVKDAKLTKPQLHLRLVLAKRQVEAHPNVITSLLSASRSPPAEKLTSAAASPESAAPKGFVIRKGYLHKLKQHWQRRHHHLRPDTHATLRRAEAHLAQVSAVLASKREDSLRVQRGIRAARENIRIETEEIESLQAKLASPMSHNFEDKYNEYCSLLRAKLAEADAPNRYQHDKSYPRTTGLYGPSMNAPQMACRSLPGPSTAMLANPSTY